MQPHQSLDSSLNYGQAAPGRYYYRAGDRPLEGVTIKRAIGRGGFGEVYFAVTDAGKQIALKHITRAVEVERRGAVHCMNLKNTNLISLYDVKTNSEGATFVLMEYVSGHSLKELIEKHPRGLLMARVKSIMSGLVNGVAELHAHDIVHRDLKPANVFLEHDVVKVGDYGLSKSIAEADRDHSISVGTCHYMAPEIRSGRYEKPVDTYAIGVILYEMLTGHPPFQGETMAEILMRHQFDQPDLKPVPVHYREIVARTLDKNPANRPKDLNEIIQWMNQAEAQADASTDKTASDFDADSDDRLNNTNTGYSSFGTRFACLMRGEKASPISDKSRPRKHSQKDLDNTRWSRKSLRPGEIVFKAPVWPTDRERKRGLIQSISWSIIGCWLMASPVGFMHGVNMSEAPNRIAFVATVSSLMAAIMLIMNHYWEGWKVSNRQKRIIGMISGMLIGIAASVLAVWLNIQNRPSKMDEPLPGLLNAILISSSRGVWQYYMVLIVFIFVAPRWWLMIERDRPVRWRLLNLVKWWVWCSIAFNVAAVFAMGTKLYSGEFNPGISFATIFVSGLVVQFTSIWDKPLADYKTLSKRAVFGK